VTDGGGELRVHSRPELRRPVLVASFRGWNDGGQGASSAGSFLAKTWRTETFAEIDPEGFFDFSQTRPQISLVEGSLRRIEWPANSFQLARLDGEERDVVLLRGTEPSLRWRTFCSLVTGLASELGVELMVTLGSLLADVPHTRPAPVTASASDPVLVEQLGVQVSRYEGPTGIVGVLHDACRGAGIPSVSLWAAVPHYVSMTPSPRAAKALCDRLGSLIGVEIDTAELDAAAEAYATQVSEAVEADEETAAYVDELESRADELEEAEEAGAQEQEIPSGDSIAAELTRFLREREEEDEGPEDGPVARDEGP
jgi:proteasome assembly chaperone (PAC2) family protein